MLIVAALSGFSMAFVSSMPPTGPIALLVLQRGVSRRYREGRAIAIGASLGEGTYAALAGFGLSALFVRFPALEWITRIVGVFIVLALGVYFFRYRAPDTVPKIDPYDQAKGERRAFVIGFSIAAANPVLILAWTTSIALLLSLGSLRFGTADKVAFAIAVPCGIVTWFSVLLGTLRRREGRFTIHFAERVIRGAGVVLMAVAIFFAVTLLHRG